MNIISKNDFYNGSKSKKKKNRLTKISIDEVSIVDAACITAPGLPSGRNFVLFKKLERDLEEGTVSLEDLNADEIGKTTS